VLSIYKITSKKEIAPDIKLLEVYAEQIARSAEPGNFVILRVDEKGERIPITIAGCDVDAGTISIAFHEVGKTTVKLGRLNRGDYIMNVAGPLGNATKIGKYGHVLCVGGGVLIAPLHFQAAALRDAGNELTTIIGARTKEQVILREEMRKISNELFIVTDDGSDGYNNLGFLEDLLKKRSIDYVVAIGPIVMMKKVADLTKPHKIKTMVNLYPIMVDGTGMCGACRLTVGGETKFACTDGPEFDGHLVDFEELIVRKRMYVPKEKIAVLLYKTFGECT
jgi:ferredoxin--NADP+ reductase